MKKKNTGLLPTFYLDWACRLIIHADLPRQTTHLRDPRSAAGGGFWVKLTPHFHAESIGNWEAVDCVKCTHAHTQKWIHTHCEPRDSGSRLLCCQCRRLSIAPASHGHHQPERPRTPRIHWAPEQRQPVSAMQAQDSGVDSFWKSFADGLWTDMWWGGGPIDQNIDGI